MVHPLLELFDVSTDKSDKHTDKLLRSVGDSQIDVSVVEGLRLARAFSRIDDSADRRIVLELAERLAK